MLRFRVLGPLAVLDESGAPVDIGGRQPRTLVAALLAAGGRSVTLDAIVDSIWGDDPPASATGTLQSYVSRLRRRFGSDAPLVWDETGYRLQVDPSQVDFRLFELLVDAGRQLLEQGQPEEATAKLGEAESLWRGPAFAEFADLDFASGLAVRLEQRRLAAIETRIDAALQLGQHAIVVEELSELVAAHPLRERLRAQHALALYRSGRQAEALRALAEAGRTLRDELGIEPGRELRELEDAILAQDPRLDVAPTRPAVRAAPATAGGAAPPVVSTTPSGLVGRDPELNLLVTALDESAENCRFVVIEGEPGIGKTRLADELRVLAQRRGALAVWGRSDEGGAAPALWPWLPPLRAIAERATDLPVALKELLTGESPTATGQAQALQYERFDAVAEVLTSAARRTPVVVLLDDLQWADETSLELLAFLAGRLGPGVLIVGTLRQLEVGRNDTVTNALAAIARRPGSRRLQLRGLSEGATAAVLVATAGREVPANVAASIHARAEGNPFYAIELSRLLDEEGGVGEEVPGSVGDVIRRRLSRLPAATVELLGVGAVVGRDVDLNLLAAATGRSLDAVLDDLDPAVVHRLLVEIPEHPGALRFSHALVRQVVLDDLTALRRARLHLRVADAIEARGAGINDIEILAEHLWRAAPVGVGRRAADALERAADVAVRRVSYPSAEDLLTKAVQLRRATGASDADHEAELLTVCRLLEVARARRYFQAADLSLIDRAKELAERCSRRDLLLDMLWFEWSALATSCRGEESKGRARALVDLTAQDERPGVRAIGHQVWGVWCWGAGRITESMEEEDKALALFAQAPPPAGPFEAEQRMVTRAFWLFDRAVIGLDSPERVFAQFDDLIAAMPDRFAVSSICGFAATTALALGCWDEADRFARISMDADPGAQFAFWGGQTLMQRGIVQVLKGEVAEALASFDEGKARYTGLGARSGLCTFEASLATNLATAGELEEAARRAAAARAELDARRELWNEPVVLIAEAVVAHAQGDAALAAAKLSHAAQRAEEQGSHALSGRARLVMADLGVPAA